MSDKPLTLPPNLAAFLGQYLPVENAALVTTDAPVSGKPTAEGRQG